MSETEHEVPITEVDLTTALHALADPVRLDILRQLATCGGGDLRCGELVMPVSKSTTTHHLKILTKAGLLAERPEGTSKRLSLRRAEFDERFPGLLDSVLTAMKGQPTATT